jgi:hypothetical protein
VRHVWLLVAVLACGTGSDEPVGMKIQEGRAPAVRVSAKAPPINALEPYERIVRAFEQCGLEGNQIVSTCPARLSFESEMRGVSPQIRHKVGAKMIAHASPAVRVQAAAMVTPSVLARRAHEERDPRVLEAFVRIASKQANDSDASALLFAAANHHDAGVRLDAVAAIAANPTIPGASNALVAIAESDADPHVRRAACEQAGVDAFYERATATVTDPDFYAACMQGLAARVTASEAAYRLFLRRIGETPRTEHTPPWTVMSVFCDLAPEQRPAWFDTAEVRRVLASVIADRAAGMLARSAAIESLAGLDATPAELLNLKKSLAAPADKPLLDKIAAICESR